MMINLSKSLVLFFLIFCSSFFAQIPTNYYSSAANKTGNTLKTALRDITKTGHVKLPYTSTSFDVWDAYQFTDVRPAPQNNLIWDMYSDVPGGTPAYYFTLFTNQCGNASVEGDCYSREHSMPNSWWGGFDNSTNPQYTDLHHLFPADQIVNTHKSNYPLGQTTIPTWTSTNGCKIGPCTVSGYTGTIFEPINEYKGDFARAQLYMVTRYIDVIGSWAKTYNTTEAKFVIDTLTNDFRPWYLNMLIQWHTNDPVSQKEINRNNAIYYNTPQNNRNPFIDHPEYVCQIWSSTSCITNTPPTISAITQSNTNPIQLDAMTISASVTDDGSVSSVSLNWGTDSTNLSNTITMSLSSSNTYFTSSPIPAQIGPKIYYKISATDNLSSTSSTSTQSYTITFLNIKAEPTNYPTGITGRTIGTANFLVGWTDPTTGEIPDGYLVKVAKEPSNPIVNPIDGIPESNDSTSFIVLPGCQSKVFLNLLNYITYHFYIFPFTNSGQYINYKTNGIVPESGYVIKCNCKNKKTLFFETMGKQVTSSSIAIADSKFVSNNLTFSGTAEVNSNSPSAGYETSSGNSNVLITNSVGKFFQISGINTSSLIIPKLSFGVYKSTDSSNGSDLIVEISCDGVNFTPVNYSLLPTGAGTSNWYNVTVTSSINQCQNLRIRFRQNGSSTQYRIDDVFMNEGNN